MRRALNLLSVVVGLILLGTIAPASGADLQGDLSLGKEVYEELCASCHGKKGDGKGPGYQETMPRPQVFANPEYMRRLTPQYMFDVAKYGKLAVLKRENQTGKYDVLPVPGFGHALNDGEIRALIAYAKSLGTGRWVPPKGNMLAREKVRELFVDACAPCHGLAGKGNGTAAVADQNPDKPFVSVVQPAPADITNPILMARFSDAYIFWLIKVGSIAAIEEKGFDTMKPFGQILNDEEIRSTVRYIWETFIEKKEKDVANGR